MIKINKLLSKKNSSILFGKPLVCVDRTNVGEFRNCVLWQPMRSAFSTILRSAGRRKHFIICFACGHLGTIRYGAVWFVIDSIGRIVNLTVD